MIDDIDLQLARRVRRRRRLLGLTQEELGDSCGIRFQQIQKYESATNKMSASVIARLAQALSVEAGYFYEGLVGVNQGVAEGRVVRLKTRRAAALLAPAARRIGQAPV